MASVGTMPSRLIVDYLRHAIVTEMVPTDTALASIGREDTVFGDPGRPWHLAALLGIALDTIPSLMPCHVQSGAGHGSAAVALALRLQVGGQQTVHLSNLLGAYIGTARTRTRLAATHSGLRSLHCTGNSAGSAMRG